MTFKDYLIEKNIPFKEEGEDIWVEDHYLIPYIDEVLARFPELDFDIKIDDFDIDDLDDLDDLDEWDDIDLDELEDEDWEEYWDDIKDEEEK